MVMRDEYKKVNALFYAGLANIHLSVGVFIWAEYVTWAAAVLTVIILFGLGWLYRENQSVARRLRLHNDLGSWDPAAGDRLTFSFSQDDPNCRSRDMSCDDSMAGRRNLDTHGATARSTRLHTLRPRRRPHSCARPAPRSVHHCTPRPRLDLAPSRSAPLLAHEPPHHGQLASLAALAAAGGGGSLGSDTDAEYRRVQLRSRDSARYLISQTNAKEKEGLSRFWPSVRRGPAPPARRSVRHLHPAPPPPRSLTAPPLLPALLEQARGRGSCRASAPSPGRDRWRQAVRVGGGGARCRRCPRCGCRGCRGWRERHAARCTARGRGRGERGVRRPVAPRRRAARLRTCCARATRARRRRRRTVGWAAVG